MITRKVGAKIDKGQEHIVRLGIEDWGMGGRESFEPTANLNRSVDICLLAFPINIIFPKPSLC